MSLINEALKRARVEAARRDAAAKGVPPEALPVYVPPRRRSWLAPAMGFAAGLAAVAVALGAFWVVRRPATVEVAPEARAMTAEVHAEPSPTPAAASPIAAAAEPAPPSAMTAPSPSPEPRTPEPRPADPAPAVKPPEARSREPAPAPPPPAAPPVASARVAEAPPRAEPPPAGPSPEKSPPAIDGGIPSYMRQASPAGKPVKIDFIVWSESRPFAQINGQQISAGQSVDGYTLLKVERERVELEGGGQRFWLRVK